MAPAFLLFANLEGEQTLRSHHQDYDDGKQSQPLCHRNGHEEFEGRLRLRDAECGCDGAEQARGATEHDDEESIDDIELTGGRPGRADHGEGASGDAGDAATKSERVAVDLLRVDADRAGHDAV